MIDAKPIRERYTALSPQLDERGRRCFAASEARAAGYGGIAATARATGIARSTIGRGVKDLGDGPGPPQAVWGGAKGPGGWVRPAGWAEAPSWRRAKAVDGGRHDAQRRLAGAG